MTSINNCIPTTADQGGLSKMADLFTDDPVSAAACEGFYGWFGWGGSVCVFDRHRKTTLVYCMTGMDSALRGGARPNNFMGAYQKVMATLGE